METLGSAKTTRDQRRQTLAKLMLGHLVEVEYSHPNRSIGKVGKVYVYFRGEFSNLIAAEPRADFPSEELCAKVALALPPTAYESCRIGDLDELTVQNTLRDGGSWG